jgi:hypothetical protein
MATKTTKPAKSKPATKRYMIRCSPEEFELWEARARELGYASAGAWMQRIANDAIGDRKVA